MRNIVTIAAKEIRSTFVSPLAYVIIGGFMLLSGFFFFTLLQQFNALLAQAALIPDINPSLNEWVVLPFYQTLMIVLLFLLPILSMRAIAEERRMGTFELLATSPLSATDIVLGKFFGISTVVLIMLLLAFCYPLVLIIYTDAEVAPILVGFLGLVLFSLAFVSLGIAISACTKSQAVSAVLALVISLVFFVIDAPADKLGYPLDVFLKYVAPSGHAENLLKGLVTGSDLFYFFSVIALGIFIANRVLDAQNWR